VEAARNDAQACPAWEEAIGAAAAGWLGRRELAALAAHTAGCAGCATELQQLTGVGRLLRAEAAPRRRRRWWA
jgi:hypothetical protein